MPGLVVSIFATETAGELYTSDAVQDLFNWVTLEQSLVVFHRPQMAFIATLT